MAFKMKGSPMQRNYNIGGSSPMTMKATSAPLKQLQVPYKGLIEGETIPQDVLNKIKEMQANMEGLRTKASGLTGSLKTLVDRYAKIIAPGGTFVINKKTGETKTNDSENDLIIFDSEQMANLYNEQSNLALQYEEEANVFVPQINEAQGRYHTAQTDSISKALFPDQ